MRIFRPGDIVMLFSGGPHMTVQSSSEGTVKSTWFNKTAQVHVTDSFSTFQLKLIKAAE